MGGIASKQRAIQLIVASNCALIAAFLGGLAYYYCARRVVLLVRGDASGVVGVFEVAALAFVPILQIAFGAIGGISGYRLAGRFLIPDDTIAWKLSLIGALCVGIITLLVTLYGMSVFAAIVLTVAWAAIPHLLKVKKII